MKQIAVGLAAVLVAFGLMVTVMNVFATWTSYRVRKGPRPSNVLLVSALVYLSALPVLSGAGIVPHPVATILGLIAISQALELGVPFGLSQWMRRRAERLAGANLAGRSLAGRNLRAAQLQGANLRGADMRGADLRDTDLTEADLTGADLRGAILHGALLTRARLDEADLRETEVYRADLASVRWNEKTKWPADMDLGGLVKPGGALTPHHDGRSRHPPDS